MGDFGVKFCLINMVNLNGEVVGRGSKDSIYWSDIFYIVRFDQ